MAQKSRLRYAGRMMASYQTRRFNGVVSNDA
jgi:hypothetical protein